MLNWQIVRCILTCILAFSFVHAPVCANCKSDSCYIIQKKKNKKEKNDPYFSMGKNTKSYATKSPAIYLFLGKGRESFVSDFIKTKLSALSALPSSTQNIFFKFRHCVDDARQKKKKKIHTKLTQKIHFLQISHLSSNRRVCNLTLYFQFTTPARELTHRTKFDYPGRHEFWTPHVSSLPLARETPKIYTENSTNFGHAMFLRYLEPEKCQKPTQKTARISDTP